MVSERVEALATLRADERLGAMATVVEGPDVGSWVVIDRKSGVLAGNPGEWFTSDVASDTDQLMDAEQSTTLSYGQRRILIESVAPSPVMLVFGAGHIAQPLSMFAKELGFRVVVADARSAWATEERFPHVDELIVAWPDKVFDHITVDQRTYVVLLSHDSRFEIPVLNAVHQSSARYVGAMGSRRTHRMRVERLLADGWTQEEVDDIHGPIGLDLKAQTPAETAIAILAEIIRVRYGAGTALSLSGTDEPIHLP